LKAGVWFRRGLLLIVSPDSLGTTVPAVRQKLHLSSCADFRDQLSLRAADVVLVINTPVITNSEPVQDELMEAERLGIPVIAISPPKRRGASRESQCEVIQRAGYRAQWTAKAIADAIRTAVRAKARVRPVPVVELPQNDYEAADAAADEAVLSHEQVAAVLGDDEDHAAPLKAVLSNDFRSLLVRAPERSHPT
jgi:hypothetical protein